MSRLLHYSIAASLLVAAITTTARSAAAQGSNGATATRVRVATVTSIPVRTASAMIVRTDDQLPLIVLDAQHADPETLDLALALVHKLRTIPLTAGQPGNHHE